MTSLAGVLRTDGLPMALYTDRTHWASHPPTAKGPVDTTRLTQLGRALARLGVEHIVSRERQILQSAAQPGRRSCSGYP